MSVEDTPETAGKFAKKLPVFRNILIEVGFPWDVGKCDSCTISAVAMRKELEYAKKMTLIAKLYRMNLLSEKEFEKIRRWRRAVRQL